MPSLHLLAGSARVQIVLFAAAAVAAALLAVGWRTRLAAYELWLCRQWNVGKSGAARLEWIEVVRVVDPIAVGATPKEPAERRQMGTALCPRSDW